MNSSPGRRGVALAGALIFTTRGVPDSDRRRVLHTLADQGLLPIEPLSDAARVEVTKWRLPGALSLIHI